MSESLRNDGPVWVPKKKEDCTKNPKDIPEADRDCYLESKYPSFDNLAPRDISSRSAKEACESGQGVGSGGRGVYLNFADAIKSSGEDAIKERYSNLFDVYESITGENAYSPPMLIYPALHYTMDGLWVDYNLMSNIPGLFVLGEANFSDHGANRLGASALMQGLADGCFVIPCTLPDYLARVGYDRPSTDGAPFKEAEEKVVSLNDKLVHNNDNRSPRRFHHELGKILWKYCGMAQNEAGLKKALELIPALRQKFWQNVRVTGEGINLNQELERAGRVADFLAFTELLWTDALNETSLAVATSVKNIKQKMAKLVDMMKTTVMGLSGDTKGIKRLQNSPKSLSFSITLNWQLVAINKF